MQLKDKVAVITGSAAGIGRQAAIRFAAEGARVVVSDMDDAAGAATVDHIRGNGHEAAYCHSNVMKVSDLEDLMAFAADTYGGVDIFWHNAGTTGTSINWTGRDIIPISPRTNGTSRWTSTSRRASSVLDWRWIRC